MSRLTIIGPDGRQEVELLAHNTLGRHPNNTVQVLDRIVSKEHCHVDRIEGGRFILRDLGSLNGTYVNGERVGERILNPGDEIMLGSTRIIFDADQAPAQPAGGPAAAPPPVAPQGNVPFGQPPAEPDGASGGAPPPPAVGGPPPAADSPGAYGPGGPEGLGPVTLPQGSGQAPDPRMSRVTIAPGMVESHIRTKLAPLIDQSFLPERLIQDQDALRRDYEKLRVSYELARAIGVELDIDKALVKILDAAFQLLQADRGVILLYDDEHELVPRCVRTREGNQDPNEEVVISSTIVDQVLRDKAAVLSSDATVDSRFQGAHSIIMQGIRSSMAVPLLHSSEVFGIMMLDSQIATNAFTEKDLQLFQNVANQAAVSIQNSLYAAKLEQEAVTRERFQRLLSPAIAQQVIEGKVEVKKGGEARETTVLFSDIRGFTAMSESQPAQEVVDMLNEYFERMVEVIFTHEGTLDKFVGDEIMALFGAPVSHEDDAYRAVKTAIEMKDVLAQFNRERVEAGQQEIRIGIGINTGECVAGYLGSSKALEYTVIGDTVNTGARLCSIAKAGEIIISESTYEAVKEYFEVVELPPTQVKGKSQALKIFNVVGEKAGGQFGVEHTRPA
ncbi:MAG TPA: adenylate/guanylate cyclase domain-containing protein [Sandaracinaceae bacterium LLY-WYZ-13_1]|nr:adenylate/guanylate cyclase domain-containing protein [Sandaracinaceae bacterium LLY-WYZ-13_1]